MDLKLDGAVHLYIFWAISLLSLFDELYLIKKNMRKLSLLLTFFFLGTTQALLAQDENNSSSVVKETSNSAAFEKGDLTLNAGFSFGLIGYGFGYYGSRSFSVPITANVNYGISDEFSVGGYIGYYGVSYGPSDSRYRLTNFSFGAQGTFHATPFMNEALDFDLDETKIDYYARLILGFETFRWTYNGKTFNDEYYSDTDGRVIFGPVIGVRYMFKPNIGVYAEGGRGAYGWLTLGASFKL